MSSRSVRHRILAGVGITLVALVLAVAIAEWTGWRFLQQPIARQASSATGAPVVMDGRFRLHLLWRPRIEVEHLNIASAERFGAPHLLDARGASLAWRWGDVWGWRQGEPLRLQILQAEQLDARLMRVADGSANWQFGPREASPPEVESDPLGALPRFGSLVIGQGHVVWKDPVADVDLDIRVRGREGEAETAASGAGYEASIDGRYRTLPMRLQVRAGSTLPLLQDPETSVDAPWVPMRVEGTVATSRLLFDGQAAAILGTPKLDGALRFRGPSLAQVGEPLGITLPTTPPFDLRGRLSHNAGVWRLQAESAQIGTSHLAGDLSFHQRAQPSRLTGELTGSKLAFADLGPAIGADEGATTEKQKAAEPAPASGPRRVLPDRRFDLPSLKVMDADVRVAIDEVDFGTTAVAPLRGLRTRVHLDAGVLRLDDLQASVAGGRFKGMTQLDANAQPAKWQARLDIGGVDVAGWMKGVRRDDAPAPTSAKGLKAEREKARQGGEQPANAYITGVLDAKLDVTGQGNSTAAILGSLDGPVDLRLRDGTLSHLITEAVGLDLAQALGMVIRGDKPLPLRCARFDMRARQGVIEPRLAVLDNQDSTVRVGGRINLRDETLTLRVVTQPKDWSPVSLRTPVTVGGTLGDPAIGIEGRKLAGRVLGALALGATVGPAAAIIPLVEFGQEGEGDPCDPKAPAAAPAEPKR